MNSYKKSSTYNIGEGVTLFTINNFNDYTNNKYSSVKKSKSYKGGSHNRLLNLAYRNKTKIHNHLGTVLETINEVSNSRIDSSQMSNNDENHCE